MAELNSRQLQELENSGQLKEFLERASQAKLTMTESLSQSQAKAKKMLPRLEGKCQDEQNPLVGLIFFSLAPEGMLTLQPGSDLDPVNWDRFVGAAFEGSQGVPQDLYQIMDRNNRWVPDQPAELQVWAEDLVLQRL
jgi:hypothetical protein